MERTWHYSSLLGLPEESQESQPIRALLKNIHEEVLDRFYGCGSPIPPLLEGCTVLDLGCGTGRDVYTVSQLVGGKGRVVGVDMTEQQLAIARKWQTWHAEKFGHSKPNTEFHQALIEDLKTPGIKDESVDVVISNCVINLAPDKLPVLQEVARVLKVGGELYFSDVYSDRRIPKELQQDKVLFGECLSGALYINDFGRLMRRVGLGACGIVRFPAQPAVPRPSLFVWADYGSMLLFDFAPLPRGWEVELCSLLCSQQPIAVNKPEIERQLGDIRCYSITVRAIKLPESDFEDMSEDFGQVAKYKGSIPGHPHAFFLDQSRFFITDRSTPVDGTTAAMLSASRYGQSFIISGKGPHKGAFVGASSAGQALTAPAPAATAVASCC